MFRGQKKLGQILIAKGLITEEDLKAALDEQRNSKEFLGKILLKKGLLKEKDLLEALSEQFNIPYADLKYRYIDWQLVKQFSLALILDHRCFPIVKDTSTITIAITNPLNVWAMKKAEEETRGLKMKFVLVSEEDIEEVIHRYMQYLRANISQIFK